MFDPSTLKGPLTGAKDFETAPVMSRTAQAADIDELGHVNNAVYLNWAQDIATAHWMRVAGQVLIAKYVWVVLRHEIDYRDQVVEGEEVEVRTWLGRWSGARFERNTDIRKPGAKKPSAKVLTDWCLIDMKTRKPRRVGPEITDRFGVSV